MSTDLGLAWLAGFMDGEGTIQINLARTTGSILYRVSFPNTNETNIREVKRLVSELLGRELRFIHESWRDNQGAPLYKIAVWRKEEIVTLLTALLPFLVGKRPQAELMLAYLAIAPGRGVGHTYGPEHYEMEHRMRVLNRKGVPKKKSDSQREAERLAPQSGW